MKKFIAGFLLAFASITVLAQTPPAAAAWNMASVTGENGKPVGYIFHTYAIGTRYTTPQTKNVTGLRLICTLIGPADPIIGIFWDNTNDNESQNVQMHIKVDSQVVDQHHTWMQEGKLTYRSIKDSPELLKALKSGKRIQFDWDDADNTHRVTMFSLITFDLYLNDFNTACHTRL